MLLRRFECREYKLSCDAIHFSQGFKVTQIFKGDRPGTKIEGWFPLVDEDYKNKGKVGDIYLVIEWYHDKGFDLGYKPSPRPDAMGQVSGGESCVRSSLTTTTLFF